MAISLLVNSGFWENPKPNLEKCVVTQCFEGHIEILPPGSQLWMEPGSDKQIARRLDISPTSTPQDF